MNIMRKHKRNFEKEMKTKKETNVNSRTKNAILEF